MYLTIFKVIKNSEIKNFGTEFKKKNRNFEFRKLKKKNLQPEHVCIFLTYIILHYAGCLGKTKNIGA